jgi:hypothetical protein
MYFAFKLSGLDTNVTRANVIYPINHISAFRIGIRLSATVFSKFPPPYATIHPCRQDFIYFFILYNGSL